MTISPKSLMNHFKFIRFSLFPIKLYDLHPNKTPQERTTRTKVRRITAHVCHASLDSGVVSDRAVLTDPVRRDGTVPAAAPLVLRNWVSCLELQTEIKRD